MGYYSELCGAITFLPTLSFFINYSLRFKTKVTFGHNLRYETKGTFGEISLKLRQTNWKVVRNNVNVVADELPNDV